MIEFSRRLFSLLLGLVGTGWVGLLERGKAEPSLIVVVTSGAFFCLAFIFILIEVFDYNRKKPRRFSNESDIVKYMTKWISSPGRIAISTRDMSWANDDVIQTLKEKAKKSELIILYREKSDQIKKLEYHGASIHQYPGKFEPNIPFTIVNYKKINERLAIALPDGTHSISEFPAGSVEIGLAKSFVELTKNASH